MTKLVGTLSRIVPILLGAVLSQGTGLHASILDRVQEDFCPQSSNFSINLQDNAGRTLSPVKNSWVIVPGQCRYYADIAGSSTNLRLVVRTSKKQQEVSSSSPKVSMQLIETKQDSTKPTYEATYQLNTSGGTLEFPLTIAFADSSTESVPVYLFLRPEIFFQPNGHDCIEGQICVSSKQTSRVEIVGSNLGEIDTSKGMLINGKRAELVYHAGGLTAVVPADVVTKDESVDVKYFTRNPFVRGNSAVNDITVPGRRVHLVVENDAITYGDDGAVSGTTVFVGESAVQQVHLDGINQLEGTYTVEEQTNQRERRVVAVLDVLGGSAKGSSKMVRILGIAPTLGAMRAGQSSFVYLYKGDAASLFHTHLRVAERPRIEGWTIRHINSRYRDQVAHPGDTIHVVLKGRNLRDFDSVEVASGYGWKISNVLDGEAERTVSVAVALVDTDRVPIHLRSKVARDTTIFIPAQLAQTPRRLDFAQVQYQTLRTSPHLRWQLPFFAWRKRSAGWARPDTGVVHASSLAGVVVRFNPEALDRDGTVRGIQYLVVDAALHSADGEKIDHDSVRVAVVPNRPGFTYRMQSGYSPNAEVLVDDLLDRLGRYSEPGARLLVSIRHDSLRYAGDLGYPATLQLVNSNRVRIRPYANLMTGVVYVARVRQADRRFAVQNGSGTDSIVRQSYRRETKLNTLSMLGSIAMEAAVLRVDGRPSFARLRLGLLALESPFDEQRRRRELGLSVLYPIELVSVKGGVSLSISAGGACLTSRECFGLVSPGFDIALGR